MSSDVNLSSPKTLSDSDLKRLQNVLVLTGSLIIVLVMALLLMAGLGSGSVRTLLLVISGLVGLVIALAVFVRPELGAFILIFTIFTNLSDILETQGFPSLNKPLVVLISISLVLNYLFRQGTNFRFQSSELLLIAFAAVSGLTFLVAVDTAAVVGWTIDIAKDVIILMAIVYALSSKASWQRANWILILSAASIASLGLYQVLTGDYSTQFFGLAKLHFDSSVADGIGAIRLQGPIDDPNFYGQMMVAVLPLAIYRIWSGKTRNQRWIAVLASLLIGFAVIFSYSRGAALALLLVLVAVLFSKVQSWSGRLLVLSLTLPLFVLLPGSYIARLQTLVALRPADTSALYQENSFRGRSSEMQAGILMWRDHPFLGVGAENYPVFYQEYAQKIGLEYRNEDRQAHSLYIQVLAETGTIGLAIFAAFLLTLFVSVRQSLRHIQRISGNGLFYYSLMAVRIGIAAYLITSIFLHADYFRYLILIISIAIAANHLVERDLTQAAPVVQRASRFNDARE